jgi:outer membrane protein assembly factor BamB
MTNFPIFPLRLRLGLLALAISFFILPPHSFGASRISLSAASGPPNSELFISGYGFAPHSQVDLYFDTRDKAVVMTDPSGSFTHASIHSPVSALPGRHWISAVERATRAGSQISFTVQSDWTEFHKQNMTRWNGVENVLNVKNVGGLRLKWRYNTNFNLISAMTVANGVVYAGTDFGLYALNATKGTKLWQAIDSVWVAPATANGVVYVPSYNSSFYAVDAATGTILWNTPTNGPMLSSPTVVNGTVYAGSQDSHVYAFDAATGVKLWSYATSAQVAVSPAVVNGVVYICTSTPDEFYALSAATGSLIWNVQVGCSSTSAIQFPYASAPAVSNGTIYVGSPEGILYALQASTGITLWSYTTAGEIFSAPAVANGTVYFGSEDGNVYALKASTGTLLWKYKSGLDVPTAPAVANGVVYVSSNDGHTYALNAATGAKLWTSGYNNTSFSSPAVANGMLYVGTGSSALAYALKSNPATSNAQSKPPEIFALRPNPALKTSEQQRQ